MEFNEQIKQFMKTAANVKDTLQTEEATKMSLVLPLFRLLGYDVFNPLEFCPEYTADVGVKKKEKVDYAILKDGDPIILIECKACSEDLDKHGSQLFRYFATSKARFGILTNGLQYRFFTDIEASNIMDLEPFMDINILKLKESEITELQKFHKDNFDYDNILSTASELKYKTQIQNVLEAEFEQPSPEFVKFIIDSIQGSKVIKTQKIVDLYTPIVKKAINSLINEAVNKKLSTALDTTTAEATENDTPEPQSKIVTTEEELDAFNIVRAILAEVIDIKRIFYRDTESYFGILVDDNNRRPICRIKLDTSKKHFQVPKEDKTFERIDINSIIDLYKHKKLLQEIAKRYL